MIKLSLWAEVFAKIKTEIMTTYKMNFKIYWNLIAYSSLNKITQ